MRSVNKSQLRRLAADFADGRLPPDEYRRRRRELIDAIVDGQQPIRREKPSASAAVPPERDPATSVGGGASVPWPLVLGTAAGVCVLALVWLLWPSAEPEPVAAPPSAAAPPAAAKLPRSRTLVESFLALRDFSAPSIAGFREEWDALAEVERSDARDTLWFRSLVRALRDEIKTQKALAGLAGGEAAMARAREVWALGEHLDVAEELPTVDLEIGEAPADAAQPPSDAAASAAGAPAAPLATAGDAEAGMPVTPTPPVDTGTAGGGRQVAAVAPVAPERAPTGREWLDAQADDGLTLQLFAVNRLDRVEQLMTAHAELPLQIVATDGAEPRYRVFHGVYATPDDARAAFDRLPPQVSAAAGGAIVKSFAAVREDLSARADSVPAAPLSPQAGNDGYTLQLFASGNRDNAQALVDAFPDLSLRLHRLPGDDSPYRVVYGRFGTPDDARAAASGLPGNLLSRIGGKPLPKAMHDTGVALP